MINDNLALEARKYYEDRIELFEDTKDRLSKIIKRISELNETHGHKVIYTTSRIKCIDSYIEKAMVRTKYNEINDIVGFRVICLTEDDVYAFRNYIKNLSSQYRYTIESEKDYISNPKKSGYRSYHIILNITVDTVNGTVVVPAEIQLRTIFMDIFARVEHKWSYKPEIKLTPVEKRDLMEFGGQLKFVEEAFKYSCGENIKTKKEVVIPESSEKKQYYNVEPFFNAAYNYINGDIISILNSYHDKDDIVYCSNRIKTIPSICRKLKNKGLEVNSDNIVNKISDVVGFKIVLTDEEEIYSLVNYIEESNLFDIIERKDYILEPKDSGYRAYHIKVRKMIKTSNGFIPIVSEIQFRTVLMDAWSTYEDSVYGEEISPEKRQSLVFLSNNLKILSDRLKQLKVATSKRKEKILKLEKETE